jgi:hypothetical protein
MIESEHQKVVNQIDMRTWEVEMAEGQPHSHFEVANAQTAELYRKAAKFGSVAVREIGLNTEEARSRAPSENAVLSWAQSNLVEKGYVGFEISTVPDQDGNHPESGTHNFYEKVKELEAQKEDSQE